MTHLYNYLLSYRPDASTLVHSYVHTRSRWPRNYATLKHGRVDTHANGNGRSRLGTRLRVPIALGARETVRALTHTRKRIYARRHAAQEPRGVCNTRRHRNPTDVQHVYVSPATLTLQFMRALTARRALPAPHNHPSVLPRLTGSLNTTANSPMYKFSHRGGGGGASPFAVYFQLAYGGGGGGRGCYLYFGAARAFPVRSTLIHLRKTL